MLNITGGPLEGHPYVRDGPTAIGRHLAPLLTGEEATSYMLLHVEILAHCEMCRAAPPLASIPADGYNHTCSPQRRWCNECFVCGLPPEKQCVLGMAAPTHRESWWTWWNTSSQPSRWAVAGTHSLKLTVLQPETANWMSPCWPSWDWDGESPVTVGAKRRSPCASSHKLWLAGFPGSPLANRAEKGETLSMTSPTWLKPPS